MIKRFLNCVHLAVKWHKQSAEIIGKDKDSNPVLKMIINHLTVRTKAVKPNELFRLNFSLLFYRRNKWPL
jgi:hypothetical protein